MPEIGSTWVTVAPDAKNFGKELESQASSGASSAGSKIGSLFGKAVQVGAAALVATGAAALALGKSVVDQYAQYEQNIGGIETMFGQSTAKMTQYAQQAYQTAGLSANEYMSQITSFSAALLQGLGGDTAKAGDIANQAMIDMADNANKFGSDITSIQTAYQGFAKQNYTMLDNLKLGYGGTQSEMARLINDSGVLGDSFTATAANVNTVSFDKIIEAIHTVQDNMGIAGTTSLEASTTISGAVGMMKASWTNLLIGLGDADSDIATLGGNVISSFFQVLTNISPVIDNIGSKVVELAPQIGVAVSQIGGQAMAMLPTLIDVGTQIISSLVGGVMQSLPDLVVSAVPILARFAASLLDQLPMILAAGMQALTALVQGITDSLPTIIPAAVNTVIALVGALGENAPMLLDAALQLMLGLAQGLADSLPVIIDALPQIIIGIVGFIIDAIPQIAEVGGQIILGLGQGLAESLPYLWDALVEIADGVINKFKELFGIHSPSTVFADFGTDLIQGLVNGIAAMIAGVGAKLGELWGVATGALASAGTWLITAGTNLITGLHNGVSNMWGSLSSWLGGLGGRAVSAFGNLASSLYSAGSNLISGRWAGVSGMYSWVMGKISGFASSIISGIKGVFGIHSPSTVFRDEVGAQLGAGLALGIEDSSSYAVAAMADMGADVAAAASGIAAEAQVSLTASLGDLGSIAVSDTASADASKGSLAPRLDRLIALTEKGQVMMVDGRVFAKTTRGRVSSQLAGLSSMELRGVV
ncbi:MAG: hypothetical protein LBN10_03375 [Propionibacteriaceae bacterium]|jgi:phage-related protein|nr:hypothetical protein [Propionibacteriaceae bacterium]